MKTPEKLINFRIYNNGADLLGAADVELPSLEWMTETVSGAGIAGEVDSPSIGQYQSMTVKITWRTLTDKAISLARSEAHHLDCRGSIQVFDAGQGVYANMPVKCVMKAIPKSVALGKFEVAKPQDNESEFEVIYLKLWLDSKEKIEIDKYNYISIVDGVDYLAQTREHLGLA